MITRSPSIHLSLATAALLSWIVSPAAAQLTPDFLYNPINRPLTVEVSLPDRLTGENAPKNVEVRIALLEPGTAKELASASAAVGRVDLSTLFPQLWTTDEKIPPRLAYAQLIAEYPAPAPSEPTSDAEQGSPSITVEKIGPALVLQPMVRPAYAARVDRAGDPMFTPATSTPNNPEELAYSGLRVYIDQDVLIETSHGSLRARLYPEFAPNTVFAFRQLIEGGLYRDGIVHRVASLHRKAEPDIIQFGDPLGTGTGGPGFFIDLEQSPLPHSFGVLSMARANDPNSAGSQLFICLNRKGCAFLDGKYTSFAHLIEGEAPLLRTAAAPVDPENQPLNPPTITTITLIDAAPYGEGEPPLTDPREKPIER